MFALMYEIPKFNKTTSYFIESREISVNVLNESKITNFN